MWDSLCGGSCVGGSRVWGSLCVGLSVCVGGCLCVGSLCGGFRVGLPVWGSLSMGLPVCGVPVYGVPCVGGSLCGALPVCGAPCVGALCAWGSVLSGTVRWERRGGVPLSTQRLAACQQVGGSWRIEKSEKLRSHRGTKRFLTLPCHNRTDSDYTGIEEQ